MGTNTLATYSNNTIIDASHPNEITAALLNEFVGRNLSGVPEAGKSLGTLAIPWGTLYTTAVVLNGQSLDTSQVIAPQNRIVSGKTRTTSSQPLFLRPNGTALSLHIDGSTTNLNLVVNGAPVAVSTDITKTGLTAAPTSNNTCLIDDATLVGADDSKYYGEEGTWLTLDTMGSEITALVGQVIALKRSTEIMIGFLESVTKLRDVYRGFFFDSSGAAIGRQVVSNNDSLTLLKLGWVFVENNGTTVDVSYRTPMYSYESPTSPLAGDYWFDTANKVWKRYSGTQWDIINRILTGCVVNDGTACIGARSFDFYKAHSDKNNIQLQIESTSIVRSRDLRNKCTVYGEALDFDHTVMKWNITSDLETGLSEGASKLYYLYLSEKGQRVLSDIKPYDRPDLMGWYHPYHTWRLVGACYNNSSSDIVAVNDESGENIQGYVLPAHSGSTTSSSYVDIASLQTYFIPRSKAFKISFSMGFANSVSGTINNFQILLGAIQRFQHSLHIGGNNWRGNATLESVILEKNSIASALNSEIALKTRFKAHDIRMQWNCNGGTLATLGIGTSFTVSEVK